MRRAVAVAAVALLTGIAGCTAGAAGGGTPLTSADAEVVVLTPSQQLRSAVARGDLDGAAAALDAGADVDESVLGVKAIHIAARNGDAAMVGLLLDRGADVMVYQATQDTPLHLAAISGDVATIEALIAAGADVHARGGQQTDTTPLLNAAAMSNLDAMEALVAAGGDLDWSNRFGADTIAFASWFGQVDSIRWAVEHGALYLDDLDAEIAHAADRGDLDIVAYLESLR